MLASAGALALTRSGTARAEQDQAQTKSANERLSVAVVGVRGQGNGHLNAYASRQDTEVVYVCDADKDVGMTRVEEIAKIQAHAPKYVQDLRRVFDDPNVDVVSTATPNHWHSLVSIWAMQAGKDVYVEKPVSHNVSEGRRMVQVARKLGRICQTGTQCRSMGGTLQAIDYVKAGKIGEVKLARGLCYKDRKSIGPKGEYSPPPGVDYNLWSGPAPLKPLTRPNLHYDWHWMWDYGNGDLGNQGIHQMDIARWGLGVNTVSHRVLSFGGRLGYEDAGETANTQVIYHDYGPKTLVFEVRGLPTDALKGAKVGVIFEGSDGYVVLSSYDSGAAFDPKGNMVAAFQGTGDHFGNFLDAVRSRRHEDLHADIEQGHLSSALCHLGNISYRLGDKIPLPEVRARLDQGDEYQATLARITEHLASNQVALDGLQIQFGQHLELDPANERFVNNAQADLMLTREYRAPFVVPRADQV